MQTQIKLISEQAQNDKLKAILFASPYEMEEVVGNGLLTEPLFPRHTQQYLQTFVIHDILNRFCEIIVPDGYCPHKLSRQIRNAARDVQDQICYTRSYKRSSFH